MILFERIITDWTKQTGNASQFKRNLTGAHGGDLYFVPLTVQLVRYMQNNVGKVSARYIRSRMAKSLEKYEGKEELNLWHSVKSRGAGGLYATKDWDLAQANAIGFAKATKSRPLVLVYDVTVAMMISPLRDYKSVIREGNPHPKDKLLEHGVDLTMVTAVITDIKYSEKHEDDEIVPVIQVKSETSPDAPYKGATKSDHTSAKNKVHSALIKGVATEDEVINWGFEEDDIQGRFKSKAVEGLTNRLKGNTDFEEYRAISYPHLTTEQLVNQNIRGWAQTSMDHDTVAVARQQAVKHEFGLDASMDHVDPGTKSSADDYYATNGAGLRAFYREMYNETQELLKSQGVEELYLFRGVVWTTTPIQLSHIDWDRSVYELELATQPMSSFTYDFNVAASFAQGDASSVHSSLVLFTKIPRERVLSTFRTGIGCMDESEVVVLGGNDKYRALAFNDTEYLTSMEFDSARDALITGQSQTRPREFGDN